MEKKLVFLDIDGTILDETMGITDRTRFAVGQARKRGNYVCIATGRCMAEVRKDIQDVGFDGYVSAAGAYIVHEDTVLQAVYMEKDLLSKIIPILEEAHCFCVLEGVKYLYIPYRAWEDLKLRSQADKEAARLLKAYEDVAYPFHSLEEVTCVNKISYFWSDRPYSYIKEQAEKLGLTVTAFSMDWAAGESGELTYKGCHKGEGILRMAEYLGIPRKDVIAIGDSANDLEMLKAAGIGIAMGNADEAVKRQADEVMDSVSHDGVYEAFVRHGLSPFLSEAVQK